MPLEKRSGCVVDIFEEVISTSIESIVIVMLIVAAKLSFGSMDNRAVKVALNRIKLEGLAATFIARAAKISS